MISAIVLSLLPACMQEPPDFELKYLPVNGRRQETLAQDFNGDGRLDLLHTTIDFDVEPPVRWLLLYLQDKEGRFGDRPDFIWKPPDRAAVVVAGDFLPGGGVEIGYAAADGVYYHPWKEGRLVEKPEKLLHLATFFREASDSAIPVWWEPTDLDKDGRHDLLIPVPSGYRVYFQTAPGIFGAVSEIEADLPNRADRAAAPARFASSSPLVAALFTLAQRLPRPAVAEIDGDGRPDLVLIDRDLLTIFFQKEPRLYTARRGGRMRFPVPALKEPPKKDMVNVSVVAFHDLDGDRLDDLVVTKIEGEVGFVESIRTSLYLHRGTGRGNFLADAVIRIDGISVDPSFVDMNNDNTKDCLVSRLRTDLLAQATKAFILGDIAITYEVFQFEPGPGRYVETPVYTKDILVTTSDLRKKGAASVPMLVVREDLSGDRRPDMAMVNPQNDELEMHRGNESRFGSRRFICFEKHAFRKFKLAGYPKGLEVRDLNGDGIGDVMLMHRGMVGVALSKRR